MRDAMVEIASESSGGLAARLLDNNNVVPSYCVTPSFTTGASVKST